MSKYTITIKNLIDNEFDFKLDSYPIFDETYREILNNKILNHYYDNEIGFETAGLFRHFLLAKLNEIMPYYNILYQKQSEILNSGDSNVNLTENYNSSNNQDTTTSNDGTSKTSSKNLFQDTPQGNILNENIDAENVYATNITLNKGQVTDSTTSIANTNGINNYIKSIIGSNGNKYKYEVLIDIINNFKNIDMMIINDLNELFMQIF